MKTLLVFLAAISLASGSRQTDNWTISHNKKIMLAATQENEVKNIVTVAKADLSKAGSWGIVYQEGDPNSEWRRTMAIVDESGNSLFEKEEINRMELSNKELKKIFGALTKLKIYTWAIPKDPAQAALVRVRRVHLCTMQLK
jgi:hypothetical protein